MKILIVNAGSSSLKYQLVDMDGEKLMAKGLVERIGIEGSKLTQKVNGQEIVFEQPIKDHTEACSLMIKALTDPEKGAVKHMDEIGAVGHRVLHGGEAFTASVLINEEVKDAIRANIPLGPLHNPANLMGIEACEKVMPGTPNVAVFDTAFHQTMPPKAYLYGVPYEYYERLHVRRYGFHGTSHRYVSQRVCEFLGAEPKGKKIITCHVGNGGSITAVKDGKSVDTSMGLTPTEGLMMGTRCGDVDPGALIFLMDKHNLSSKDMLNMVNKESGLAGVSGVSSDMREITAAAKQGNEKAILSLEMYEQRITKYVGAFAAEMGGVDIIVFTGGVGEHQSSTRANVCNPLRFMGVEIDDAANDANNGDEGIISTPNSAVKVVVIPTDEEYMIAKDTEAIIEGREP